MGESDPFERELAGQIRSAVGAGRRLAICGGGSKVGFGRLVEATRLELGRHVGILDYDPTELVLTVRAGTLLRDIEALLAAERQMLAFEPFDYGPLFGKPEGCSTIGGIIAAGVSGSRRLTAGAARDHILGFRAVSGRGEIFAAGGRVVKNVTGFDLPQLATGSWGRLFALTELSLRVLPAPETSLSLQLADLSPRQAVAAMSRALGSSAAIAAAAHVPASAIPFDRTVLRIEGFGPSVQARSRLIAELLDDFGSVRKLAAADAEAFWSELVDLSDFATGRNLWRAVLPASQSGALAESLAQSGAAWRMDWGGGLVWIAAETETAVRTMVTQAGGHATLVRADTSLSAATPAFHPLPEQLSDLEERVRRAFDPGGVFETGRF